MSTKIVNSMKEMRLAQRGYLKKVKEAFITTARNLAEINVNRSREIIDTELDKYPRGGALLSHIKLKKSKVTEFHILSSDYDNLGRGIPEIEEGLGGKTEMRYKKDYPKLANWMKSKGFPRSMKGVKVGGENSRVHPNGIHYFQRGFDKSVSLASPTLMSEINKINV